MKSKMKFLLCVTIVLLKFICVVKCCNTFGSINIEIFPRSLPQYIDTIEGCIEPSTVENAQRDLRARKVIIRHENIPNLKHGTVQNLPRLEEVKMLNCSVKTVKVGAFRHLPRLRTIDLESNKIKTINKVFQDLPLLSKIILDHNEIDVIENGAFANLENLNEIYLRFNKIKEWNGEWFLKLPEDAFAKVRSIEKVYLSYNNISTIEKNAFNGIERLNYLDLSYNYIKSVDEFCFTNQITIANLFLNANKLNFLPSKVLDKLEVENFAYDGNPWLCSCYNEVNTWLISKNVSVKSSFYCNTNLVPVCTNPEASTEKCLEIYDEESTELYFSSVKDSNNNFLKRCIHIN